MKKTIISRVLAFVVSGAFAVTAATLPAYAATTPTVTQGPNDDALISNVVVTPSGSNVTVSFNATLAPGHTTATIGSVIDEGVAGPTTTFTSGSVAYSYEFTNLSNGTHEVDVYTSTTTPAGVAGGDYVWTNTYSFPYSATPSKPCSGLAALCAWLQCLCQALQSCFHF